MNPVIHRSPPPDASTAAHLLNSTNNKWLRAGQEVSWNIWTLPKLSVWGEPQPPEYPGRTWDRLDVSLNVADPLVSLTLTALPDTGSPDSRSTRPLVYKKGLVLGPQHFSTLYGFMWPAQVESPPFTGIMMISMKTTNLLGMVVFKTFFPYVVFFFLPSLNLENGQ